MAYTKVSALTAKTTPAGTEELLINDGGVSKKITQTNLLSTALPLDGGTMTGDVSLGDNVKAKFGASDDLQIYHDGSNSYVSEVGTGSLIVRADQFDVKNADASEYKIRAITNGAVSLYHDSSPKLATTSTGIDVTGSVTCDGFTSTGIDDNATSTAITIDASENVRLSGVLQTYPTRDTYIDNAEDSGNHGKIYSTSSGVGDFAYEAGHLVIQARVHTSVYRDIIFAGGTTTAGPLLTVKGEGDVVVNTGNLVIGTSGKGIDFSADGNAAGMTSEVLDDYEEGTWTPVIGGDSGTSGQTYSVQDGYYTKIGNTVTCNGRATLSAKGTLTGGIIITGLPFSSNGTTTYRNPGSVGYFGSLGASVVDLSINMTYGVSTITVYKLSAAGIVRETMDTTAITDTTQIDIAITYKV
jgi:hypothetical protein